MIDVKKKILITGATGYLGTRLIRSLLDLGATNLHSIGSGKRNQEKNITYHQCDISSRQEVFDTILPLSPQIIIHLAAIGTRSTGESFSLEDLVGVNGLGTIHLIDAAEQTGVCEGFLNISSIYEYGPQAYPINEVTELAPHNDYALSKTLSSLYATKKSKETGFPIVTYRLSSVYGPGDTGRIVPFIIDSFRSKRKLRLFDIHQKRDIVFIEDVIFAVLEFDKAIKKDISVLNIGSGYSITAAELVHKISQILGQQVPECISFEIGDSKKKGLHWECDVSLFSQVISTPVTQIGQGLSLVVFN